MKQTLQRGGHPLADPAQQREVLAQLGPAFRFERRLDAQDLWPLQAQGVTTLQINVGKRCNQTCAHCHVDAGPDRKEVMPDAVVDACLRLLRESDIGILDITGGAPELHPRFREIVRTAAEMGRQVIHRCNLTAVQLPRYRDIPALLADHGVRIVASLPHPEASLTDRQRGDGVYEQSIRALLRLNHLGYGRPGTGLELDLVTNPVGAFLPGSQAALEKEWRQRLARQHGVIFNHLFAITNMPISRFLTFLVDSGNLAAYMHKLQAAYNPAAAASVMCRTLVSVGWDGTLYDCDFNQMLELPVEGASTRPNVLDAEPRSLMQSLQERAIRVAPHCFGCAAGSGSSCGGSLT